MINKPLSKGDRITWNVWGIQYTGTIIKVVKEPNIINKTGDIIAREDKSGQHCNLLPEGEGTAKRI